VPLQVTLVPLVFVRFFSMVDVELLLNYLVLEFVDLFCSSRCQMRALKGRLLRRKCQDLRIDCCKKNEELKLFFYPIKRFLVILTCLNCLSLIRLDSVMAHKDGQLLVCLHWMQSVIDGVAEKHD
jgi:hypothetical protein